MKYFNIGLLILICLTGSEILANERVLNATRDYIVTRFDLDPESVVVSVRKNRSFDELRPTDSLRVYSNMTSPPRGSYSLKYDIVRNGVTIKTLSSSARVRIYEEAYVANRKIDRGEDIDPGDFRVERCDVTYDLDKIVRPSVKLDSMRADKTIRAGEALEYRMVERIPVIARGDEVVIRCAIGSLDISTLGVAKEDGCVGDRINVMNKETRKRLQAEVESEGVVIVNR